MAENSDGISFRYALVSNSDTLPRTDYLHLKAFLVRIDPSTKTGHGFSSKSGILLGIAIQPSPSGVMLRGITLVIRFLTMVGP